MSVDSRSGEGEGSESASLFCYTRKPTGRQEANNEDVALSMHLAIRSAASGDWEPLNAGYGIFFAAAVPVEGVPAEARGACRAGADLQPEPRALQGRDRNQGLAAHDNPDGQEASPVSPAVGHQAVMPGEDLVLKSLIDPFLLRLHDGTFAILATRTARGGRPDGSEADSFLLALSPDLIDYHRLPQVHIQGAGGVHRPRAVAEGEGMACRLYWEDDGGHLCTARMDDLSRAGRVTGMTRLDDLSDPLSQGDPLAGIDRETAWAGCGIEGAQAGNVVGIDGAQARALMERFGRIYNTGVEVGPLTLPAGGSSPDDRRAAAVHAGEAIRSTRAVLSYNDGSRASRAVDWDQAQVEALTACLADGTYHPGRRLVRGRVRQTVYPVPFARQRADPSIFRWTWKGSPLFMFIATEDADGNCVDPRAGRTHMPLRVADTLSQLSDEAGGREREIDLLRRGDLNSEGRAMTGCFWAPEIHVIGGRLSILFMPCFDGEATNPDGTPNDRAGLPDMWTGSCHIMQLRQDAGGEDLDPRQPGNWTAPSPILRADGGPLNPVQRISLDMTVFQDSGTWYYAWQQVGSIWIATFDPDRPDRLTGSPRQIVVPEFAWDNMIAEGPNAVVHGGRIYLIYSGSLVGIDYTTGLVTAPAGQGEDLTNPAVWSKLDYPLQKSGLYNGEWQLGTGHGMWSEDEDGNMLYVFHNAEHDSERYLGRDSQVRRVHWSAEGMPVLDMQADEELDPTRAFVTLEVNVL